MEISVRELLSLNKPKIIDIRPSQKYNDNHIPNAVNINYTNLINNPGKYLDKNNTYYVYCQRGITSKSAVELLRMLGYDVFGVIGGYEAYVLNNY